MRKVVILCSVLLILLPVALIVGCQRQPVSTPTPVPAPAPAHPVAPAPPTPPTPSPASTPEPAPIPTLPPAPAEFELKALYIEPKEAVIGETVNITAVVENIGGSEGVYAVILTVDGALIEAKEVEITAGSSKVVVFSLVKNEPGAYEIGIEELKSTLIVKEEIEYIEIKYDDGTSEGAQAIGMYEKGHVVHFSPPVLPFRIDAIKIYGSLYGTGYEKLMAEIEVWDENFNVLYSCEIPHTIFSLGAPEWVAIDVPGVFVDGDFYIFFLTNSLSAGGIMVDFDASVTNTHSDVTWERKIVDWYLRIPKEQVNWMIRVQQGSEQPPDGEEAPVGQENGGKVAKIEITFDPNPVGPDKDNRVIWKTILTEVNGVGVYLSELTREEYIHDNLYESKQYSFKDIFPPDAYLPAFGSLDFKGGFPFGSVTRQFTHCIHVVVGIDDNGNEVRAEGRVDFDFVQ